MSSHILRLGMCHTAKGTAHPTRKQWGAGWVRLAAGLYEDGRKRSGSSHLPRAFPSCGDAGDEAETELWGGKASPPPPLTLLTQTQPLTVPFYACSPPRHPPSKRPSDKRVSRSTYLMKRFSGRGSAEPSSPARRHAAFCQPRVQFPRLVWQSC